MSFSDIEFKASSGTFNIDQAQGIVECFVAGVGNKDSVGDVLLPGAFNGSLRRRKPRVVWGHNWNDPIGKVLEIYEVPPSDPRLPVKMKSAGIGGLYARVQFNLNSEKGKEAFANVAFFGEEQEWSIGYKTIQASFDPNLQANILKEVELYEVSPVLHGANQLTGTISVKSDTAVLEESKGHGMPGMPGMPGMMPSPGMPSGMMKPMAPKPQQVVKPVRPSIPESPLMVALRRELVKRSGSNVIVRTVTENIVIFDRLTSDGQSSTYRVAYNFQNGDFMFGKPERVQAQTVYSPAETERATPMENFNVSIKPQADAYMGDDPEEFIALPGKSEDFDFDGFDFDDLKAKVGRALNNRNLSKLKTVMEMLQDIVASAEKEKEVEVKEYLIAVDVKDAFHTKQLLDPIMDYHRVDSYVSEKGIVVTSGITPEFIEAVETLKKGIGNRIGRGGGGGKVRRLARGAASFDPKAWDGDGDGLVQEGTPFQRPAIPGVNDRASRGRGINSGGKRPIPTQGIMDPKDVPVLNPKKMTRAELERNARQAFSMLDDAEKARGKEKPKAPLNPNLPQERLRGMASSTSSNDKKKEIWDKIKGISLRQPRNASDENPPSLATEGKKNRISKKLQQWATRQAYEASQYSPYFIDKIAKENNLDPNGVEMRTWASINRYDKLNNAMKILYARRQDFLDAKKENGSLTPSQEKELKTLNKTINSFSRSHQNAVRDITENLPEDISKDILDEVASPNNINNEDWPKPGQSMRGLASRTPREADRHWEFFSDTTQEDRARAFFNITEGRSENLVGDKMLDAVRSNEKLLDDIVESAEGLRKFYQDDLEFDLENSKEVLDILNLKDKTKMKQKLTELANGTEKDSDILAGLLEQYGVASNEKYEGVTSKAGLEKVFDDEVFDFLNEYTFDNGPESWKPEPVRAKDRRGGMRSSTEDSPIPERSQVFGGFDELDSSVLNFRMLGNSLKETAKNLGIPEAQVRQREIAELKRLRESGTDKDLLAYRLNGLSLTDTAKLFNTTPEKVRQREAKEMARMRKDASDMDISDYRNRGVSLDSMAELLGTTRQNIRKREMRPVPPDPPMTDEQMNQMARDRGMRSSTGNPRPVSMTLSNDEIGELRDEVTLLKKYSANNAALDSFDEKLKNSKNGKIDLTSEEIKDIEEAVGSAMNNADGKIVTSDIDGVLGQTIESPDGKYVSPNWEEQQAGGRGNLGMRSKTPNNGAPPQIDEARQKKLVFFMNSAEGGRLGVSRRIREQYAERGDGTMPARDWKALNTLYGNRTGDKLPIETERFRDGREDGGGMRSSTEESVGRDRSAGMSVSGLGEVGKERGTRGRSLGGGEDVSVGAKRYSGKKFNDVKPDNWDGMSNDDKFEWLFSNSPERSGMSSVEYDREIQKLLKEEGLLEDRRSRKERIAESAASGEKPESGSVAKRGEAKPKGVKVTPRPDNEKDAAKQRKDDYSLLEKAIDKQIGDVTKLNDKDRISQMHVDAWDEIGEIMDSDDLSKNQIKATIQRLKNYLEDATEADETEGSAEKIVDAARKLLKTMQVMDTYYGKDKFIADGPEINIIPRTGVAGQQLADVSDDAFDIDSVGGMRSRVPVNASKVVSSSVKDYVASRSSRNSGMRSSTGRTGRTEIKEEATFFKDILDSLPKEISEAKKNNDRKTSQALEKLSQIINRQEAAKLGDKRTNAGRILLTRDEVDEVLDAVMMVIDRQGAKGGGARQEKFAKFIDMLAKAAMATFIDRTVEELGGRTTTRQTSRGRSVEIQDL